MLEVFRRDEPAPSSRRRKRDTGARNGIQVHHYQNRKRRPFFRTRQTNCPPFLALYTHLRDYVMCRKVR